MSEGSQSSELVPSQEKKDSEIDAGLIEKDGAIGYYKNRTFQALTNFSIACKGFVSSGSAVEGYLIEVIPASCQCIDGGSSQSSTHYITLREMSSQLSILSKIPGKGFWTAPSREQYLPAFFKEVCDNYLRDPDARELLPVKRLGYQPNCNPPLWVIGRNLQVQIEDRKASQLTESESPCCVLDGVFKVPHVNIAGGIDQGEALKELIKIQEDFFKDNFVSSLMLLGCMTMAVHYEHGIKAKKRMPLTMAIGHPNTSKSTAIECALSVIGRANIPLGDTTYPRLIEELSAHALPLMWDDVSNFAQLEGIALMCYNRSCRKTMKKDDILSTIPLLTVNPSELDRRKLSKEKAMRIFSRILVIPFKETTLDQSLIERMRIKEDLEAKMEESIRSSAVILQLYDIYNDILGDPMASEIQAIIPAGFDTRTQDNYFLLLFTICKLLSVLGLKDDHFAKFSPWLNEVVLPVYKRLMMEETAASTSDEMASAEPIYNLILQILEKGVEEPEKISEFFVPHLVPRGCGCGDCFAFNVPQACKFIDKQGGGTETMLRSWVQKSKSGCTGRKVNVSVNGKLTCMTCCHIKKEMFPTDLLGRLKEALVNQKKKQGTSGSSKEDSSKIAEQSGENQADLLQAAGTSGSSKEDSSKMVEQSGENQADLLQAAGTSGNSREVSKISSCTKHYVTEEEGNHADLSQAADISHLSQMEKDDLEKQMLDNEVLLNAAMKHDQEVETDETQMEKPGTFPRKQLNKRGKMPSKVTDLLDGLHPGNMTGKRRAKIRKIVE